jgi:cytochrome b6-f complex iron-sulfur subunit
MAERPSVKDILAAARRGGPAKPAEEASAAAEPEAVAAEAEVSAAQAAPAPAASAPPPAAPLGRPLTLKEKLAAARAGGAPPAVAAPPVAAPAPAAVEPAAEAEAEAPAAAAPAAPPIPTGRPLTLKEKLAAARAAGGGAPAAAAPAAGAKPAAAKAAAAAAKPAAAARTLPPLEQMSDPRDLAEALRRTGAEKEKAAKEAAAKDAPAKPAPKKAEVKVVPPRPSREAALAEAVGTDRRAFLADSFLGLSWVFWGWATFTAGMGALTLACARFMFPNVLAEPPSTIKVGLASNFEKEEVNDRWKAEWGFWIVRSGNYNGADSLYAIQSVCTHLGCPPNWLAGEQKFKCPCHGSGFYISGVNFEGPAPRPLERFKVALNESGEVVVDKSQKFQEELGQWTDPDSFIPMA